MRNWFHSLCFLAVFLSGHLLSSFFVVRISVSSITCVYISICSDVPLNGIRTKILSLPLPNLGS